MSNGKHLRTKDEIQSASKETRLKAWEHYQVLKETMPDAEAIKEALRQAKPTKDDPYYSQFNQNKLREFDVWKKHDLWPPAELAEQKVTELTPSDTVRMTFEELEEVIRQGRKSKEKDTVLDTDKHRKASIVENDLLQGVKQMLEKIEVQERPTTAPGRESSLKTVPVGIRLPKALADELDALGGKRSHHIEKAISLYLRAMRSEE